MVRRGAAWALILLLISVMSGGVGAQSNLLRNPGFEEGFASGVASNWTRWNAPRTDEMPSFQNGVPVYLAASGATAEGLTPRVRTGNNAQIYYSFFETHDAGLYQQVSGITPGTELRFSIYAYVWSSTFEDDDVSEEPGDVAVRVGIDPTGGTDPFAASVIYTDAQVFYDAFRQYNVTATAQASTVTVFVRSTVGEPVQSSAVYLDDAVLEVTSQPNPPVATDTSVPTTVANVPTNTPVPPTNTVAVPTNTPVAPTNTVAAPATIVVIVATDTRVPQGEATPTSETGGPNLPTATTFVVPTSTPVPSTGGNTPPISEEFPGTIIHVVRSGDVVFNLARTYGSSVNAIIAANGLNSNGFIRQGQSLVIPVRIAPATETASPLQPTPTQFTGGTGGPIGTTSYTVQPGDTLSVIAARFNTTLNAIAQLNGISNPNLIYSGQRLVVPATGGTGGPNTVPTSPASQPPIVITVPVTVPVPVIITATPTGGTTQNPATYLVQPGDSLYRISVRFNVSMLALARANNITNYNLVFAGSTLVIPR